MHESANGIFRLRTVEEGSYRRFGDIAWTFTSLAGDLAAEKPLLEASFAAFSRYCFR